MKRMIQTLVFAALVGTQLSACVGLLVAGAAGGALMSSDRRSSQMQIDDKQIEFRASNLLNEKFSNSHVNVSSYNRVLLLTGEVPTAAMGKEIEAQTAKLAEVNAVINELGVGKFSDLSERTADTAITTKVKTALFDDKLTHGNAFRVTTERGVVYLQGRVTQQEGTRAAELARTVSNVRKVVKVLDYLTEEDLKRFSN
jgi:osmotically-inducible protein OsmY